MNSESSALLAHVRRHARPEDRRAWFELASTGAGMALAVALYVGGWWPLAVPLTAGIGVRNFVIFHDALHRSFFVRREWNVRLAQLLQVVVLTPAQAFRENHLHHHRRFARIGFVDNQDYILFTRAGFAAMPPGKRALWRVLRAPWFFFPLLALPTWLVEYPLRTGNAWVRFGWLLHGAFAWFVSPWHLLAIYLYATSVIVINHLHHGISSGYRSPDDRWRFDDAAMKGSTWVPVPRPFAWCLLGIQYHHIHHLNPGVPGYRLADCHAQAPEGAFQGVTRGTWRNCLHAMGNVMWDEERGELGRF